MDQNFNASAIRSEGDFNRAIRIIKCVSDYTLDKGVIIGLENLLSVENLIRLVGGVDNQNVKVYFDTQNYYLRKRMNISETIESLVPYIYQVHVKDGKKDDLSGVLLVPC